VNQQLSRGPISFQWISTNLKLSFNSWSLFLSIISCLLSFLNFFSFFLFLLVSLLLIFHYLSFRTFLSSFVSFSFYSSKISFSFFIFSFLFIFFSFLLWNSYYLPVDSFGKKERRKVDRVFANHYLSQPPVSRNFQHSLSLLSSLGLWFLLSTLFFLSFRDWLLVFPQLLQSWLNIMSLSSFLFIPGILPFSTNL